MANLYADQNISLDLVQLLRWNGHTTTTAREQRFERAPDDEHLLIAAEQRLVLITQDEDFLLLHSAWLRWPVAWHVPSLPQHAGIIILQPRHYQEQFAALDSFLTAAPSLTNELFHWWHSGGWHQWNKNSRRWVPYEC